MLKNTQNMQHIWPYGGAPGELKEGKESGFI